MTKNWVARFAAALRNREPRPGTGRLRRDRRGRRTDLEALRVRFPDHA